MTRTHSPRLTILFTVLTVLALAGAMLALILSTVQAQEGDAPAKPTGLSAEASQDSVVLTWDDPDDDSITGYVILRRNRDTDAKGQFTTLVADTGTAATAYTDDTVQAETSYTYRVKAINASGESRRSRWLHVDTPAAPTPEPPAKPRTLTAEVSHDSVTLNWRDPQDNTITGYVILRRDKDIHEEGTFETVEANTETAETTYTDDTVEPERRNVYRIKAINSHGVSEISSWVRAYTPAAPTTEPTPTPTPEPNTPATGAPTIGGTAQVGETLTADTSGIADENGLTNATFAYQWLADDAAINGATGSTYALTDAEEGKAIVVRVSFTDDSGNEETLTSATTAAVEAQPNRAATGTPTISGTAQVSKTLTADVSGIADEDGLASATFNHLWLADDADISGATGSTYTVTDAEEGKAIKVRVSFTDDEGNEESLTSAATAEVAARPNIPASGQPTITGTAQVGETLTADTSGVSDEDGLQNARFSHQWIADDAAISGATGSTYTLADADEGKTINVRVSFTDDRDNDETLTSTATAAVAAKPNSPATGAPTISGTAQVGETLTANVSSIADEDGLDKTSFSYQWLADDADITGATGSSYTLADAQEGKTIKVRVSFSDDAGNDDTLTSEATAAITPAQDGEEDAKEYAPVWSATMTAGWVYQGYGYYSTDSKQAGSLTPDSLEVDGTTYTVTMIETTGWWMYIGLDRELPFDFALELDGAQFASGDASFNSYSYGNIYRWTGTGLGWSDGDAVEVRLLHAVEAAANIPATGAPAVTGTAQVGETLSSDTSAIADQDGLEDTSFSYQWTADGADIAGATGSTYTLAEADEGRTVSVRVSFTDDAGNEETLTSEATGAVESAPLAAPTSLRYEGVTSAGGGNAARGAARKSSHGTETTAEVVISWNSVEGADEYRVQRCETAELDDCSSSRQDATPGTNSISFHLPVDEGYYFRVRAYDGSRKSDYSDTLYVWVEGPGGPGERVYALSGGVFTSETTDKSAVGITWTCPDNANKLTLHRTVREGGPENPKEGGTYTSELHSWKGIGSCPITHTDNDVTEGHEYFYRVRVRAGGKWYSAERKETVGTRLHVIENLHQAGLCAIQAA